jgi:hypothetical protein
VVGTWLGTGSLLSGPRHGDSLTGARLLDLVQATFPDMRWGELAGLRRENIDLEECEIRIRETLAQLDKGGLRTDTPKSHAGKRTVSFPVEIAPEIQWHLERFAEPGERGFVFVGPKGAPLRRSNFHRSVWSKAREQAGLPALHFHDLRQTGGTLSAAAGATPRRTDGTPRPLERACRADLPARLPRPGHREGPRDLRARRAKRRGQAVRRAGVASRAREKTPVWHVCRT